MSCTEYRALVTGMQKTAMPCCGTYMTLLLAHAMMHVVSKVIVQLMHPKEYDGENVYG